MGDGQDRPSASDPVSSAPAGAATRRARFRLGGSRWLAALALLVLAGFVLIPREGFGWEPNTELSPPGAPPSVGATDAPLSPASAEGTSPGTFYEQRLLLGEAARQRRGRARTSIHEHELEWVATRQDARVALMASRSTGFDTRYVETQVAEIPEGWHTGRHRHGEEAIYVLVGTGFIEVEGVRYDLAAGTTIGLPYGAAHQLFNTGPVRVRYLSANAIPIEEHVGLAFLEQLEDCGATTTVPELPVSQDGLDGRGRRIRLLWEQARYRDGTVGVRASLEGWLRAGLDLDERREDDAPLARDDDAALASGLAHHGAWVRQMTRSDFPNRLVLMSGMLIDAPGTHSGKHSHMDAVLYVAQGTGFSIVDDEKVRWEAGTTLHVQGPQTSHEHFNTGHEPSIMLRIASPLRPILQDATTDVFPELWFGAHGPIEPEAPDSSTPAPPTGR